jgi:hypothetical protein
MIYLIEARHTEGRLDLHVLDWWNLLGLAAQYGWPSSLRLVMSRDVTTIALTSGSSSRLLTVCS